MTPFSYFVLGFLASFSLGAVLLAVVYAGVKRSRSRTASIKGYLDLIPDLTEQQRRLVEEIRRVFLPKVEGIRQSMRSRRLELAELLFAEPPDRTKIFHVAESILNHQAELEREVIEHILEEKEILSLPQKRRFYEIILSQFAAGGLGVHDVGKDKAKR